MDENRVVKRVLEMTLQGRPKTAGLCNIGYIEDWREALDEIGYEQG